MEAATVDAKPVRKGTPSGTATPTAKPAAAAPPDPGGALTSALSQFGITYPNAPKPSAALLAFVNGLGLNLGNAQDAKRTGIQLVNRRTTDAQADLERNAARGKENVTTDLLQRGVQSSGEANTRYQRQAEDVASRRASIGRSKAEGINDIENAYQSVVGAGRVTALDRVLNEETSQATMAATNAAQEAAWRRQEETATAADERTRAAQAATNARWEKFYKTGSF